MVLQELLRIRGMEPRDLYSTAAVGAVLGVHRVSVCRLINSRDLKAIRRGRAIIGVTAAALSEFLEARNGDSK